MLNLCENLVYWRVYALTIQQSYPPNILCHKQADKGIFDLLPIYQRKKYNTYDILFPYSFHND